MDLAGVYRGWPVLGRHKLAAGWFLSQFAEQSSGRAQRAERRQILTSVVQTVPSGPTPNTP
jgi:hypothetical protein